MQRTVWRLAWNFSVITLLCLGGIHGFSVKSAAADKDGRELFQQHCAVCHPGGGNIINPNKTLDGETLAANGIVTAADIVTTMRQPGPGMPRFDQGVLPDQAAGRIAEHILQTY